jgi:hypothetical protein
MIRFKECLFSLFNALILTVFIQAIAIAQQTDNGSLTGIVYDPNAAAVPGATVTAKNIGTGITRTVTSNEEGRWTITALPLGQYEVKVESGAFKPATQVVTVTSGGSTTVDLILGIEVPSEGVEITANSGSSTILSEDSAVTGSTVSGRTIESLPVPTRSALSVVAYDTSASGDIADPLINGTGNPETSFNGGRTTSVSVTKDGIDATNLTGTGSMTENFSPAPETVQEVKVLSSMYDASLGRNGGGTVQITTRGGTNTFAGTAYIYAQNEKFNANDFFFNRDGIDRQRARRLEGGFTVGGPIISNKLFFFGGYQKTEANTAYVPTAQSYVVLPAGLALAADRTPEGLRKGFASNIISQSSRLFVNPNCIAKSRLGGRLTNNALDKFCIDPFGPGYKLFSTKNPITGDYLIPTLKPGRYDLLYLDPENTRFIKDPTTLGFSSNRVVPRIDFTRAETIAGGHNLARFRNVFPADFAQDQFTTRLDYNLFQNGTSSNTLYGTLFFADFPTIEPFIEDTMVSPFPLNKNDRNRTLAIADQHVFNGALVNEARFGYFYLNNSRELDERVLTPELTNTGLGIRNPATIFNSGPVTERCARVSGQGNLQDFQVCAPTSVYNKRRQTTLTFADNVTYTYGNHVIRFGVEHKRNYFDTNLPEEQSGDFERLKNFNELLLGYIQEADTSFGITDKEFRFNDLSFYINNDWKIGRLTLNLGLRWDWFGWPEEKNGRLANFDPSLVTNTEDPRSGFLLASNAKNTGIHPIDASLPMINRANTKHTLNSQDLNNFAPRVGFALKPFNSNKTTIRGGYGIFYDRPSASFMNTIYKNYPFFKEIEETEDHFNPFAFGYDNAFAHYNPLRPFSDYLPIRLKFDAAISGGASRLVMVNNPAATLPTRQVGDIAEPIEFRSIERNLKTPMIQQWNLSIQQDIGKGWIAEGRYVGTRGQNLLMAVGFNQAYDLNDPSTPDYIFERLNNAYLQVAGNELNPGTTARERGCGKAFGASMPELMARLIPGVSYPVGPVCSDLQSSLLFDYNFDPYNSGMATDLINANVRAPYFGLDTRESIQLQSRGYSTYHSGQFNISKRLSKGVSFNASYTFSKSIDIGSTDPGSTASSGRPDTPNLGLVIQGDQRNLNNNRAVSDFDRTHRFSSTFVWEIPSFGSKSKLLTGWQLSGFGQWQSGTPFTILASESEFFPVNGTTNYADNFAGRIPFSYQLLNPKDPTKLTDLLQVVIYNAGRGSGVIFDSNFSRPNVRSLDLLKKGICSDITRCYFNTRQNPDDPEDAALIAAYGRFGNLGRNVLRGPSQRRVDLSLQKLTRLSERLTLELKWDVFNVFNFVNFANPNADLTDETDFGLITKTVGAPRVMQFGAKVRF